MMSTNPLRILATLIFLWATLTAGWPWPPASSPNALEARQQGTVDTTDTSAGSAQPAASSSGAIQTASPSNSQTASDTKTNSASDSKSNSATSKRPTATGKISYDPRLPAGGITLLQPAATVTSYYKIGDHVTFAWNFTSLSASPTAINIMATCSVNQQLYTIATNQSIDATSVVWDTGAYQNTAAVPFPVASYTLLIYDSQSQVTAAAAAGYLAAFNSYKFGMYTPQAYTPLGEFTCVTCSGALSSLERQALGTVGVMSVITVLSFTWFIGGSNIIW